MNYNPKGKKCAVGAMFHHIEEEYNRKPKSLTPVVDPVELEAMEYVQKIQKCMEQNSIVSSSILEDYLLQEFKTLIQKHEDEIATMDLER